MRIHPSQIPTYYAAYFATDGLDTNDEETFTLDFGAQQADAPIEPLPGGWKRYRWILADIHAIRIRTAAQANLAISTVLVGDANSPDDASGNPTRYLRGLQPLSATVLGATKSWCGIPIVGVGEPFRPNLPLPRAWDGRIRITIRCLDKGALVYTAADAATPANVDSVELARYRIRVGVSPMLLPDGSVVERQEATNPTDEDSPSSGRC